jgi:hypothetical protein
MQILNLLGIEDQEDPPCQAISLGDKRIRGMGTFWGDEPELA